MDSSSSKRAVGWVSALRKGSGSSSTRDANGPRDEAVQFCNRIGCSGRLNHTKHTPNQSLTSPKRPSSRSSNIKEGVTVTNVKNLKLQESKKKLSSKPEIEELRPSASNHKSKSRVTEPISRSNGQQKTGLTSYDAQIGLSRRTTVKKRSTEGETSSSKGKKVSGPSSVRTRRPVNLDGPHQSMVQSAGGTPHEPQTEPHWLSGGTSSDGSNHHGLSNMVPGGYNVDSIANVIFLNYINYQLYNVLMRNV